MAFIIRFKFNAVDDKRHCCSAASNPLLYKNFRLCLAFWAAKLPSLHICRSSKTFVCLSDPSFSWFFLTTSSNIFSLFMKSVLAATYQNLVHIYTHKSTFTFCNKKKSRFKFSTLLSLKLVSLNIVSQTHSSKKGNSLVDCNFYTYTKEVIQQLVTTIWNFTFFFSLS